ncbi:GNAT family N-acetyltransferase [Streptomyces sp. SAJ15]|uniref:GNAT family N-acetyltransferase n=1 Tax=Streptomyces sp. SAJ15 TaxID=2011095 RepID=UPI0021B1664F|nr:GNAT family N-acetyltransferase [Streptomyces sp. SAJ15]
MPEPPRPRARWSWGILHEDELIGLSVLRRRTPAMGTISYILREDTWGNGYATETAKQVVVAAFTTAGLDRLEAMHHPDNPASGRVLAKAGFTSPAPPTGTRTEPPCRTRCTPCTSAPRVVSGLIERRGESLDVGLDRLAGTATGTVGLDARGTCDLLLHQQPDADLPDDRALLIVRFPAGFRGRGLPGPRADTPAGGPAPGRSPPERPRSTVCHPCG